MWATKLLHSINVAPFYAPDGPADRWRGRRAGMQSFLGLFIVGDDGSRLVCLTSSAEVLVFRPGECARVAHLERRIHPASLANSYLFGFSTEEGHYLTFGQLQYASKLRLRVEDCNTVYHDSPAALDHLDLFKPSRDEQDTNKASIESCLERCGPSAVRTAVLRGVALIRHHGDAHAAYHAAYHLVRALVKRRVTAYTVALAAQRQPCFSGWANSYSSTHVLAKQRTRITSPQCQHPLPPHPYLH